VTTPVKLGAYAAGLVVAFAATFAVGSTLGPLTADDADKATAEQTGADGHGGSDGGHGTQTAAAALPGLAVSDRGYTLLPEATTAKAGTRTPFRFTVTGPDGHPVTAYRESHEKDLHLIVVRRDTAGFQHVHPVRDSSGVWSVPLDLGRAGTYRVFADFAPAALGGDTLTLGTDIAVAGRFVPLTPRAPQDTATVDGYEIRLEGAPTAGSEAELTFTVSRNGRPVTDLEPYLGADGHLVSLRTGDLAYLHTHPTEEAPTGGPRVQFGTTFPTAGTYRLFLDFAHGGTVRTPEFTVVVPGAHA
jgi:hypothetical protein